MTLDNASPAVRQFAHEQRESLAELERMASTETTCLFRPVEGLIPNLQEACGWELDRNGRWLPNATVSDVSATETHVDDLGEHPAYDELRDHLLELRSPCEVAERCGRCPWTP